MTMTEWVNSMDNPTNARYAADRLWKQGLRASDRTILELMYGYTGHDLDVLCAVLDDMEQVADARLKYYNPEIGF